MIRNFFINSYRNMRKHFGYLILNLTGLTIGLTSFLLISLYVFHELSYDKFHKNYENIYRIKITGMMAGSELNQAVTAAPMAQTLLTDYPEALGIKLVAGRFFSKEYGTDTTAILINETAVKSLGMTDPLGKYLLQPYRGGQFLKRTIIGVMKDFNIESLHSRITPVCLTFMPGNYPGYLCIRLNGKNIQGTIRAIENLWNDYSNKQPFQYSFFADEFNKQYESEYKAGRIFILFSVLAIFIACLGLIGLITYMTTIRTREVGIRKTFGASKNTIVTLLSREVIFLIIISSLVAYPVAFFGVSAWLNGFAEKVSVTPFIYIIASLIGLAIGWLSISYQAIKAADSNPAESLRHK